MKYNIYNKGFTLIELLLVIALIGIISIIVIPQIKNHVYDLDSDSKKLYMDICEIRAISMTKGENYQIILSDNYYEVINNGKLIKKIDLTSNCILKADIKSLKFKHTGALENKMNDENLEINLTNIENNKYKKILIVPYTGKILLVN